MSSIIALYKANNANFTASSSEQCDPNRGPYNAFNTEGDHFNTCSSPYYWQVSFPQKVTASSYQLGGKSNWGRYTTKFEVSYSNDGTSFVPVQTNTRSSPETTYTFAINPPISCKHFRLTAKEVSANSVFLTFYKFDLFGSAVIPKERARPTYNSIQIKAKLIVNVLIIAMQS